MEQEPNPELPIHLFVECDHCNEKVILDNDNTLIFEAMDNDTFCPQSTSPRDILDKMPKYIEYFKKHNN